MVRYRSLTPADVFKPEKLMQLRHQTIIIISRNPKKYQIEAQFLDSTLCIKVQFFLNSHSANILLLLGTLGTWDRNSFKLMGHLWWAIVVICAIVLIFARWAKKWVQNKTHHITITFSWLCDELIQATILLKWYLRSISQHLLFHPIVIKKWWKCDGPS